MILLHKYHKSGIELKQNDFLKKRKELFMNEPTKKRDTVFRILISLVALAALLSAFTYMMFGIVKNVNATNRLLIKAFMASDDDIPVTAPTVTSAQTPESDIPTAALPSSVGFVNVDLSSALAIDNRTSYTVDEKALKEHIFEKHLFDTRPMVLIYHSDPSAAYRQEGCNAVDAATVFASSDPHETVVFLGETLREVLSAAGIASLHVTDTVTDPSSLLVEYRAVYPSLQYALDLTRSHLTDSHGAIVRSESVCGKQKIAQLALTVSAAQGTAWQKDLAAAYTLAALLKEANPYALCPTVLTASAPGHDTVTDFSLAVGTSGNTLTEAVTATRFFGRYFALFILSNCGV